MVNTILKEADLFCPNSVRINFTIYLISIRRFRKIIVNASNYYYTAIKIN
ncbi:ABC transporter ATP-binding protein [Latilactobacillus curvatus]|nr:ABC transporter ATP-binding protein [Latilactobacillus curvatus]